MRIRVGHEVCFSLLWRYHYLESESRIRVIIPLLNIKILLWLYWLCRNRVAILHSRYSCMQTLSSNRVK